MLDPAAAADNITGIAAAEVIEERRRIKQHIADASHMVRTATSDVAAHWAAELRLAQAKSVVEDLKRRLAATAAKLEEGGVHQAELDILNDAARYGRAENYLTEVDRNSREGRGRIETELSAVLAIDTARYADALTFSPIAELDQRVSAARDVIAANMRAALAALDELAHARNDAATFFADEAATFRARYAGAKERQTAHSSLIKDSERLTNELKAAAAAEDAAAATVSRTSGAVEQFGKARTELADLVEQRFELLKRAAKEVRAKSSGALKAKAKPDLRPEQCIAALCALFEGSRFRDTEHHCAEWLTAALKDDVRAGWAAIGDALARLYHAKIMAGSPAEPGAETAAEIRASLLGGQAALSQHAVARVFANMTDQSVGLVLSAVPDDWISLTYVSDGHDIAFRQASEGQQASALLRLLLSQSAGTLIIDQPEDDLDNRVMMKIVELIRQSKCKRQLIFATHNANLVVNGDADKVVTMVASVPEDRPDASAPKIRVDVDGAIETPSVRDSITDIMEGGLDAFDLRARKYGIDPLAPRLSV